MLENRSRKCQLRFHFHFCYITEVRSYKIRILGAKYMELVSGTAEKS